MGQAAGMAIEVWKLNKAVTVAIIRTPPNEKSFWRFLPLQARHCRQARALRGGEADAGVQSARVRELEGHGAKKGMAKEETKKTQ